MSHLFAFLIGMGVLIVVILLSIAQGMILFYLSGEKHLIEKKYLFIIAIIGFLVMVIEGGAYIFGKMILQNSGWL